MAKCNDLKRKLQNTQELVFELLNETSLNPVTPSEEGCIVLLSAIYDLIRSAIQKATQLVSEWPEEP